MKIWKKECYTEYNILMYIIPTDIEFTDEHKDQMLESAKRGIKNIHLTTRKKYQPYEFITDYSVDL